eukprot:g5900.t1
MAHESYDKQTAELILCRQILQQLEEEVKTTRVHFQASKTQVDQLQKELKDAYLEKTLLIAKLEEKQNELKTASKTVVQNEESVVQFSIIVEESIVLQLNVLSGDTPYDRKALDEFDRLKLEREVQEKTKTSNDLRKFLNKVENEKQNLQLKLTENETEITKLTKEITQLKEALEQSHSISESNSLEIKELEQSAKDDAIQFQTDRDLLQQQISNSQASIKDLKQQTSDLTLSLTQFKSISENLRKEKELLVFQLERLQSQVKELELHQMDATSLYKEYKQLKSDHCEFKSLKRSHEEMQDALRVAYESTQTQLLQLEQQRTIEKDTSTSRILELTKELEKSRNLEMSIKEKYQNSITECFELKGRFSEMESELIRCQNQIASLQSHQESKIEELEQYIHQLRGQSMEFPLSKEAKKQKTIPPIAEEDEIEVTCFSTQMSPEQLIIEATKLVWKLKQEKLKSAQKDEYVEFIRQSQKSKNQFIQKQENEKWKLKNEVKELKSELGELQRKLKSRKSVEEASNKELQLTAVRFKDEQSLSQKLSNRVKKSLEKIQIQALLVENSRLRSDPFSSHLSQSGPSTMETMASVRDLQQLNLSLERKLRETELELKFIKKQKIEDEEGKKIRADHEIEIENKNLKSKICNLEVLLQHSTMQCSTMEKTFDDLKQTRDQLMENLSREEEIKLMKRMVAEAEFEKSKASLEAKRELERNGKLQEQLERSIHEQSQIKSELELLKHQMQDVVSHGQ